MGASSNEVLNNTVCTLREKFGFGALNGVLTILFTLFTLLTSFNVNSNIRIGTVSGVVGGAFSLNAIGLFNRGTSIVSVVMNILITTVATIMVFKNVGSVSEIYRLLMPFVTIFCILNYLVVLNVGFSILNGAFRVVFRSTFSLGSITNNFLNSDLVLTTHCNVTENLFDGRSNVNSTPVITSTTRAEGPIHRTVVSSANAF